MYTIKKKKSLPFKVFNNSKIFPHKASVATVTTDGLFSGRLPALYLGSIYDTRFKDTTYVNEHKFSDDAHIYSNMRFQHYVDFIRPFQHIYCCDNQPFGIPRR